MKNELMGYWLLLTEGTLYLSEQAEQQASKSSILMKCLGSNPNGYDRYEWAGGVRGDRLAGRPGNVREQFQHEPVLRQGSECR